MFNKSRGKYPPPLESKFEFMIFLEFLEKATGWERGRVPDSFFSKDGIEGITDDPVYIYILKYGKVTFHHRTNPNEKSVFICLGQLDKDALDIFDGPDYTKEIILDSGFIRLLAAKNPELWWLFVASCSERCRITLNNDKQRMVLLADKMPCIYELIDVTPCLDISRVSELSRIFENDFIYRRRQASSTYVIVGNGVSIPFGSDLWGQLSDYLFNYLKPQYLDNEALVRKTIGDSNYSTTSMSKAIISSAKYSDALHSCIYRKYEGSMHSSGTLLRAIALSKKADNRIKLISYNYDEFLEIDYNNYCGCGNKIVPVCSAREDASTDEPKVRHVHGFVSLDHSVEKNIVLTQEEYYRTYKSDNWIVRTQEEALNAHCLYVGSSMSDLFQMSLIDKVRSAYYKNSYRFMFTYPWCCYALLCLKGLGAKDVATIYTYFLNKGIRVIYTEDFDELATKYSELMA